MAGGSVSLWQVTKALSLTVLSVLLVDVVFSGAKSALGDSANQYSQFAYLTILYFCVGAFSAAYLYKGQQSIPLLLGILGACFAGLLLLRLVVANLFLQNALAGLDVEDVILLLLRNAAIAGFVVAVALVIFVFLYRMTETELNRAHTTQPEPLKDARGKECITATCSHCNQRTEIESNGFFGKTKRSFCSHCKTYIDGNPLKEIVSGLAIVVFCIFSMIAVGGMINPRGHSSNFSVALFFLFLGLIHGARLAVAGLVGVAKNRRVVTEDEMTVTAARSSVVCDLHQETASETKVSIVAKRRLVLIGGTLLVLFLIGLLIKPAMDSIDNRSIASVTTSTQERHNAPANTGVSNPFDAFDVAVPRVEGNGPSVEKDRKWWEQDLRAQPQEAQTAHQAEPHKSPLPVELGHGLSLVQVMQTVYGSFDAVRGGSFWAVSGATGYLDYKNGNKVFVQPFSTHRYAEANKERVLLVTHAFDVENEQIVKPGDGCHACGVIVGLLLYERLEDGSWGVIAANRAATSGGQWGGPPYSVAIAGTFYQPMVRIEDRGMNQGVTWGGVSEVRLQDGFWKEEVVSKWEGSEGK